VFLFIKMNFLLLEAAVSMHKVSTTIAIVNLGS